VLAAHIRAIRWNTATAADRDLLLMCYVQVFGRRDDGRLPWRPLSGVDQPVPRFAARAARDPKLS
jgi:hypothetical protein